MDELWSGSENRIFVTFSVSRNARFRGLSGEKELSDRGSVCWWILGCECRAFILCVKVV